MTPNDIQEALSTNFVRTVAQNDGINISRPTHDYGEDLMLHEHISILMNGKKRFAPSGRTLSLQLKSVNEKYIKETKHEIKYSLEAKTYNDLIRRRNSLSPLILILFIVPDTKIIDWIDLNDQHLLIKKCGYFFLPKKKDSETKNKSKILINIPLKNRIEQATFSNLFNVIYS